MDGEFGPWHLLVVAGVFMMLFGYKRMPDAARSLARSLRIFKSEMNAHDDDKTPPTISSTGE
jgi:sec-independent protein translocase protein TatA